MNEQPGNLVCDECGRPSIFGHLYPKRSYCEQHRPKRKLVCVDGPLKGQEVEVSQNGRITFPRVEPTHIGEIIYRVENENVCGEPYLRWVSGLPEDESWA